MHPVKFTAALTLALPFMLSAPALAQNATIQTEAALQTSVQNEVSH